MTSNTLQNEDNSSSIKASTSSDADNSSSIEASTSSENASKQDFGDITQNSLNTLMTPLEKGTRRLSVGLLASPYPNERESFERLRRRSTLDPYISAHNLAELQNIDASQSKEPDVKPPFEQRKSLLLIFSFITAALSAGLVYGWPALRRSLVTNEHTTLTESQLGLIFTVGSWSTTGGRFFVGLARDRISGTRTTACVCLLASLGGVIGLAFCGENNAIGLTISLFCIGIGGGATLCLQPVAGLFPLELQGSILATIGGMDQMSGVIFLILIAISSNRRESFGPYAVVLGLLLLVAYKMLPKEHFVKWEENANIENEASSEKDIEDNADSQTGTEDSISNYVAPMDMPNVADQIKSCEHSVLLLWLSIQVIPLQYYVASIGFQMERKGDDDGTYTNVFTLLFVFAAIAAPLIGKFIDVTGLGIAQGVGTTLLSVSLIFLELGSIPLWAHVFGMVCYIMARMMIFAAYFTNLCKRFGFTNFGTLAGLGMTVTAIASLFQYPLISLAATGNHSLVNFASGAVAGGLGLPYCYWLWRREKAEERMNACMK
jgi:LAT3 family solute carrier family 43 protein 3